MAQSGYTPISLYYSTTASAAPTAGNLVNGELAINITDGRLYYKDNTGTVKVIAGSGGAGVVAGSNTQVQYNNNGVFGASSNMTFDGTTLTVANFNDSSLTSGRVVFAGASGNLTDSANLTWNGTIFGITGALTASADSSFTSTGALLISKGTTAQQPGTPATGMMRYNTTTNQFEGYSGASPAWKSIGGSALSNDTSTSSNLYPVFAAATSGTAENLYTSNAKYLYKPSTGDLQAEQLIANNGFVLNPQTLSTSYTIPASYSASTVGPFTVPSGMSVTVSSGARWVVL